MRQTDQLPFRRHLVQPSEQEPNEIPGTVYLIAQQLSILSPEVPHRLGELRHAAPADSTQELSSSEVAI